VSDEQKKGGHLTLVAEGDPEQKRDAEKARQDSERKFAQDKLSWAIRELASNLMRILAGGGKSYEILAQIKALAEACTACDDAGVPVTGFVLEQALRGATESRLAELQSDPDPARRPTEEQMDRWAENGELATEHGREAIVRAALRVMASRIVGQGTQERTAEHALFDGIRWIEEGRKKSDKYYSSPKYAENLRRKRAAQRREQEVRLTAAEANRAQARDRRQPDRKRSKKIGIYDDLDEMERRARQQKRSDERDQD
jgi:hypothetical protein